jgi:hypothetical protein
MTRRTQDRQLPHWQIKSVRVRVREGPERLRQAYRLLLQPAAYVAALTPETHQRESRQSGGA